MPSSVLADGALSRHGFRPTYADDLMSELFSPITLRDVTLRNRTVVAPMCMYSSIDGFANDWHFVHLRRFG
jgi:hypothetical protein